MAVDRGEIDQQLQAIRESDSWWEQREFRELAHLLYPGERLLGLVNGKLLGRMPRPRTPRRWLIVATTQRLLCLHQGTFGRRQIQILPDMVTRVYHSSRVRNYQIAISTTVQSYRIRIPKAEAFRFVQALSALMPRESLHRLSPSLEALSWVPGMSTFAALPGVERMLSKATVLTAPEPAMRADMQRLEDTVERLQAEVDRLTEHVAFLEQLLEKRAEPTYLTESTSEH
jgi:hypothetical protein